MIIDAHTHVVPDGLPFGLAADDRWPTLVRSGETGTVVIAGRAFRRVRSVAWDPGRRAAAMAADGVDLQVVSPMPELLSYWARPADGRAFCRAVNEWLAEFVAAAPGRFHALGIVPLQDPDVAAALIPDLAGLGLRGVLVGSNVAGVPIADDRFVPFFRELAAAGLAGFVHAFHPRHTEMFQRRVANAVTFPWEMSFATSSIIARGLPVRVPSLRLAVSHGGGGALATLPRLVDAWESDQAVRDDLEVHPLAIARLLYYDSLVFDPRVLDLMVDLAGADRVILGSDFPFMPAPCHRVLTGSRVSEENASRMKAENALHWLGVPTLSDGAGGRDLPASVDRGDPGAGSTERGEVVRPVNGR